MAYHDSVPRPESPLRRSTERRPRTVLLGCSFAGLEFIHTLRRRAGSFAPGELVVVEPRARHSYIPLAHEAVSGARGAPELLFDTPAFVAALGGEWIASAATSIDPLKRSVTLENGRSLSYDRCVIAIGSRSDVPPDLLAAEGVIAAKWVSDAVALRERLHRAGEVGAREVRVIVAGCALTAVEWGAEIATMRLRDKRVAVTIVGASPRLLREFDPAVARRAGDLLRSLKVEFLFGKSVIGFADGHAITSDGGAIPGDLLLWAGGVRAHPVLASFGVPLADDGRVMVTSRLAVPGLAGLYAIGDAAQIVDGGITWPTMQRAIEAIWQGATLGRRFARGHTDDAGPEHRLRPDFWYGMSLGAGHSAIFRGARSVEHPRLVRARRWLQWAYYRRFRA